MTCFSELLTISSVVCEDIRIGDLRFSLMYGDWSYNARTYADMDAVYVGLVSGMSWRPAGDVMEAGWRCARAREIC